MPCSGILITRVSKSYNQLHAVYLAAFAAGLPAAAGVAAAPGAGAPAAAPATGAAAAATGVSSFSALGILIVTIGALGSPANIKPAGSLIELAGGEPNY